MEGILGRTAADISWNVNFILLCVYKAYLIQYDTEDLVMIIRKIRYCILEIFKWFKKLLRETFVK